MYYTFISLVLSTFIVMVVRNIVRSYKENLYDPIEKQTHKK